MTKKQILILGVIFTVLAMGILLKAWVRSAGEGAGSAVRTGVALADFNPAKIERILIGRGLEQVDVQHVGAVDILVLGPCAVGLRVSDLGACVDAPLVSHP